MEKENWRTRKRGKKLRDSVGDHERGKAVEEKERRMEQTAVGCPAEKKSVISKVPTFHRTPVGLFIIFLT